MNRPPHPPHLPSSPQFPTAMSGAAAGGTSGGGTRRLWLTRDDGPEDQFDALTDLFLGEVTRPRREEGQAGSGEARPNVGPGADGPRLRLAVDEVESEASALVAEGAARGPAGAVRAGAEAKGTPGGPTERAARPPFVECVVVGNLPVLASAWASQYVREVARAAERPVAYLRVQAGYVTVEIVGEPEGGPDTDVLVPAATDLEQALRQAAAITERWVVRVDHADEATVAARRSVRLVTLITGPDEAARVHAYGSLKDLGERLPKGESAAGPVVRVAVMSAAEGDAGAAGRRLVETVKHFLGRDVQHAVCAAKIRATRAAQLLFNGRMDQPTAQVMERLEHVLEEAGGAAARTRVARVEPPRAKPADAEVEQVRARVDVPETPRVVERPIEPVAGAAPVEERAESRPSEAAAERLDDVSLWAGEAERGAVGEAEATPDGLSGFVAGVRALDARCPYAAGVEIGVDEEGQVHLMARSAAPGQDDSTLGALMVAAAWVESHAALLGAVAPGLCGGRRAMHLFTATPKASRRLLETDVRVHVLAPVRVGDRVGWCCVELN